MAEPLPQKNKQAQETAARVEDILSRIVNGGRNFTGKIVFTINCRNGGVGGMQAHIQKEIK